MKQTVFSKSFLNVFPLLSALMVVGIHSYNAGVSGASPAASYLEGFLAHGLFTAAVPVFFILSGYLFFRNTESVSDVVVKQKKRARTLLIPYLAWSAFYYVFNAVANRLLGVSMTHAVDLSLAGILRGVLLYEYCFPMWYLFN